MTTTPPVSTPGGVIHDPTSDPRTARGLIGRVSNSTLTSVLGSEQEPDEPRVGSAPANTALTADQILKGLSSSKFLTGQLKTSSRSQLRPAAQKDRPSPETVRERIQAQLQRYEVMFASGADGSTEAAMKLALAMDGVAKVMAETLYDTTLKPRLAEMLFRVYGPKIAGSLKRQGGDGAEVDAAVQLAQTMVSGDPVARFMHHEMRLDQAAFEVKALAVEASMKPRKMFDLLSQRYQAQMGSYSFTQVEKQQDKRGAYNIREVAGELSTDHFQELFGTSVAGPSEAGKLAPTDKDPSKGLRFTPEATARLRSLGKAVATAPDTSPLPDTAEERLEQHLADVTATDDRIADGRRVRVEQALIALGAEPKTVKDLIDALEAGLPRLPLTITVSGLRWFGNDADGNPKTVNPQFRSAGGTQHEKSAAEGVGKRGTKAKKALKGESITYGGRYDDPEFVQDRGDTYLEFRQWKDRRMTSNLGMRPEELPVFGAVNTNWEATRGTGYKDRPGENYYGDTHFVLDPNEVRDRLVYTAGDHGQPHTDPFLAFADFLLPKDATEIYNHEVYRSDVTRMKPNGVTNSAVHDVINMLLLGPDDAPKVVRDLPFEIQIFGGIDLRRDVKEIHVAPGAPVAVFNNATDWARDFTDSTVEVFRIAPDEATVPVPKGDVLKITKQALADFAT